ncbi:VOC family protein [Serratia liquefaciens]|uniref:VOC family protein n=1 Tax=Serratia liquefaciens TaxID=614 RepID=UPI002FF2EFE1
MKIAHVALWTRDIDAQVTFWQRYFDGVAGEQYVSRNRPGFVSRFVSLAAGPTLEIMSLPDLLSAEQASERVGWAHIALSVGEESRVDQAAPRWTGDGFYEAIIRDPDGNAIEITA